MLYPVDWVHATLTLSHIHPRDPVHRRSDACQVSGDVTGSLVADPMEYDTLRIGSRDQGVTNPVSGVT